VTLSSLPWFVRGGAQGYEAETRRLWRGLIFPWRRRAEILDEIGTNETIYLLPSSPNFGTEMLEFRSGIEWPLPRVSDTSAAVARSNRNGWFPVRRAVRDLYLRCSTMLADGQRAGRMTRQAARPLQGRTEFGVVRISRLLPS